MRFLISLLFFVCFNANALTNCAALADGSEHPFYLSLPPNTIPYGQPLPQQSYTGCNQGCQLYLNNGTVSLYKFTQSLYWDYLYGMFSYTASSCSPSDQLVSDQAPSAYGETCSDLTGLTSNHHYLYVHDLAVPLTTPLVDALVLFSAIDYCVPAKRSFVPESGEQYCQVNLNTTSGVSAYSQGGFSIYTRIYASGIYTGQQCTNTTYSDTPDGSILVGNTTTTGGGQDVPKPDSNDPGITEGDLYVGDILKSLTEKLLTMFSASDTNSKSSVATATTELNKTTGFMTNAINTSGIGFEMHNLPNDSFTWVPSLLPGTSTACQPFNFSMVQTGGLLNGFSGSGSIDICDKLDLARQIFGWLLGVVTILRIFYLIFRSNKVG